MSNWKSIEKDGPPKEMEKGYLVCHIYEGKIKMDVALFKGNDYFVNWWEHFEVVAWQELPEPYKPDVK